MYNCLFRAIYTATALSNAGTFERLEWLSNTEPATWLAEGHVISNKFFITHLANSRFNLAHSDDAMTVSVNALAL